jgi:multidrug efflux pump subunit AcrA (membrane-fusion protein)
VTAFFRYWREVALLVAAVSIYYLGSCARARGEAVRAWQDSVAVVHQHAAQAIREFSEAARASHTAAVDLDSARAAWRRALLGSRAVRPRLDVVGLGPASVAPMPSAMIAAGQALDMSCTTYENACERAQRAAQAAIDSLKRENQLLRRRSPDPSQTRFSPFLGLGYVVPSHAPALRAGLDGRIGGGWHVSSDVTVHLVRGDTARWALWITKRL